MASKPMQSPEDFNEELTNRDSHVARTNGSKMVLHTHTVSRATAGNSVHSLYLTLCNEEVPLN